MSQLHSKQNTKAPPPENSLATGGCFERNTSHVTAIGQHLWHHSSATKLHLYISLVQSNLAIAHGYGDLISLKTSDQSKGFNVDLPSLF